MLADMAATIGKTAEATSTWQAVAGQRRVRYVERMVLSAHDLQTDEAYRLSARRRHELAGHEWGIVLGLALAVGADRSTVRLQPGVAVDGFGREIVVDEPVDVDMSHAAAVAGPNGVDVWLLDGREPYESAHTGRRTLVPRSNDRWPVRGRLRVTPATTKPDPWALLPEAALDGTSWQGLAGEPGRDWPVFLGRIRLDGMSDPAGRLYAALRGEAIDAASGTARLLIGSDETDPNLRFAVALPDASGAFRRRLVIDRDGNTTARGQLRVIDHDVKLTAPRAEGERSVGGCEGQPDDVAVVAHQTVPALSFPVASSPLASASPWNVYRAPATEAGRPRIDQLSFECGAPEGNEDPARYRFAVGIGTGVDGDERKAFRPCLTVDAGCAVRIAGKLEVRGKLSHGPLRANPADPTFVEALTLAWMTGAEGARPPRDPEPEIT